MRVMDHLLMAVRDAAVFNPEVQEAPACILWPDRDRQWEAVIPRLQSEMPELHDPRGLCSGEEDRTGDLVALCNCR